MSSTHSSRGPASICSSSERCSRSSALVGPTTTSASGTCGIWWPGTPAGSRAPVLVASLRWFEGAADEVLGPDGLVLAGLDRPHGVGDALDRRPQDRVQLAA